MKIHKLSIIGFSAGAVVIIASIIRWFFLYYDPSQLVLAVSIGLIICGFAYLYDWMRNTEQDYNKLNKRLDAFSEWWAKQELS